MSGICLNIGCGLTVHSEWLCVDTSPSLLLRKIPLIGQALARSGHIPDWPHAVRYGNVVTGLALPKSSCDLVYASHIFEHLSLHDLDLALRNLFANLKAGGRLRLLTPDLEKYARAYVGELNGANARNMNSAAPSFMNQSGIGLAGSRRNLLCRLNEALSNARHQWLWDTYSMTAKLIDIGFWDVQQKRFAESADRRFLAVEEVGRHEMSFCLECIRP